MEGTARIVRADPGTKNVEVEVLQKFFRANGQDSFTGEKSLMYGKSMANQRVEAWTCVPVASCDPVHMECLRFCFMGVI